MSGAQMHADDEPAGDHTCDNCMTSTDSVVCDECQGDISDAGAQAEREAIAKYIEENATTLSGHTRKPWLALAASIRACEHHEDEDTSEPSGTSQDPKNTKE